MSLAGPIAESLYTKKEPYGSDEDFHKAIEVCYYLGGGTEDVEADINCAYNKTEQLLKSKWDTVERMAKELLTHKTLSYRAAKKIIEPLLEIPPKSFLEHYSLMKISNASFRL